MMISGMCASVQAELDAFFGRLHAVPGRIREVSAQAFSKARQGFSGRLFELASAHLLHLARPHIEAARWNGRRVVAADASRLRVSTRKTAALTADHYAFALFLPGTELTLHASLHQADGSERQMLFEALDALDPAQDLLVLDRGYVGNTMAATLAQHGMAFCLRVDASGWRCVADFRRSNEAERVVTLSPPTARDASTFDLARTATTVRLIRNIAPNGQIRVLMTNLLDAQSYPAAQFSALYHQRWRVEEAFKRIKHRLRLEATTGLNYLALQQDFAAKILADNLCALLSGSGTDDAIQTGSRPNRTYAFGALKPILAGCLLGIAQAWAALPDTLAAMGRSRCRIQPGRSYPRPPRSKPHLHMSYKGALS